MVKIAILGIVVVLLALPFQTIKKEYSVFLSICGCIMIFYFAMGKLQEVVFLLKEIGSYIPFDVGYLEILIKIVGIAYLSEFSSDICKDAGYSALAGQIGIAGKLTIIGMSTPVIAALLKVVSGLWG